MRWVMVLFLLFSGVSEKTVASITNYTDRQVRNIRDQFENSYGAFLREGKKWGRKKKIKRRMFGRIVKYITDHPRSTLKDVAAYLKDEYKLEVSVKKIRSAYGGLPGSVEAILTLLFLYVFGIERLFHLEDLSDLGFATLTGRNGVLSRTTLFRWMKKSRKSSVLRVYDLTRSLSDFVGKKLKISIDEHVVAR